MEWSKFRATLHWCGIGVGSFMNPKKFASPFSFLFSHLFSVTSSFFPHSQWWDGFAQLFSTITLVWSHQEHMRSALTRICERNIQEKVVIRLILPRDQIKFCWKSLLSSVIRLSHARRMKNTSLISPKDTLSFEYGATTNCGCYSINTADCLLLCRLVWKNLKLKHTPKCSMEGFAS